MEKSTLNLALYVAKIHVGLKATKDTEVVALYGNGYFVSDEGHSGGRYYINRDRSVTLHTVIGVDDIIEQVELSQGIEIPSGISPPYDALISPQLETMPVVDKNISFGMMPDELINILGSQKSEKRDGKKRIIEYEATEETDTRVLMNYSATYTFIEDKLVKVSLYDGC